MMSNLDTIVFDEVCSLFFASGRNLSTGCRLGFYPGLLALGFGVFGLELESQLVDNSILTVDRSGQSIKSCVFSSKLSEM